MPNVVRFSWRLRWPRDVEQPAPSCGTGRNWPVLCRRRGCTSGDRHRCFCCFRRPGEPLRRTFAAIRVAATARCRNRRWALRASWLSSVTETSRLRSAASRPPSQASEFLVLTPPADGKQIALATLPKGKTTLVVLPKWDVTADDDHPGWVRKTGLRDLPAVAAVLPFAAEIYRGDGPETPVLHAGRGRLSFIDALPLGSIDTLQTIGTGADWTPVLMTEGGQAVLVRKTNVQPPFYVLSDPDLLDTKGLKDLTTARAALTIMDGLRANLPITFDVTLNGLGRSPSVLRLLFEPPLLGATVCATIGALLILIMALNRFGPAAAPARVLDFGKRALADNSAGLIALAGREANMAVPYAQLTRTLVLREIGAPPRLSRHELDAFVDAAARSRGLPDTYTGLASAAADVRDRAALIALAKRLHTWAQGLRRGHR